MSTKACRQRTASQRNTSLNRDVKYVFGLTLCLKPTYQLRNIGLAVNKESCNLRTKIAWRERGGFWRKSNFEGQNKEYRKKT